jgi:hypothetical protein
MLSQWQLDKIAIKKRQTIGIDATRYLLDEWIDQRKGTSYIMEVRCHATKRFLIDINIEQYISELEKIGVAQQTPIIIKIPCKSCKAIEEYELYKNKALFIKSYKKV